MRKENLPGEFGSTETHWHQYSDPQVTQSDEQIQFTVENPLV